MHNRFFFLFNREIDFINRSIASIVVQIPKFEKNFNVIETRFCYSLLSPPFLFRSNRDAWLELHLHYFWNVHGDVERSLGLSGV